MGVVDKTQSHTRINPNARALYSGMAVGISVVLWMFTRGREHYEGEYISTNVIYGVTAHHRDLAHP